jgi:hypothetical protein
LLLGGDVWRTPASGGGGTQGLLCKLFFGFGVLCVKIMALYLDRRFPRARTVRVVLQVVPATFLIKRNSEVF